jgi:site-specific DNA recombinase
MPSTNGHGLKQAILYARVSTDEQARSGYSLAQQMEALRGYAAYEGYEVLEEINDSGHSGASLERPGMDWVRDLVATGGVSVVLAQDRDRFAREPAYLYILKKEFEEHGCALRALNSRDDDTPEGELTDGILDQLSRYERAKVAERSRRGKHRAASEGKVITAQSVPYGYRYISKGKAVVPDEPELRTVRRVFELVAAGTSLYKVKRALDEESVPTPSGKARFWSQTYLKKLIIQDAYRPHSHEELAALVSPGVAAGLDPTQSYGVLWYGRQRHHLGQRAENGPNGRIYRKTKKSIPVGRERWIAIPIPNAGIPREVVNAARERVKSNKCPAKTAKRAFWELSGGIARCGHCGRALTCVWTGTKEKYRFYYRCNTRFMHGPEGCGHYKNHRAETIEDAVWREVSSLLKEPEHLRTGVEHYLEQERRGSGDAEHEMRLWAKQLASVDAKRSRYQDMAAEGLIDFDELRSKLGALVADRRIAVRELEVLSARAERFASLKLEAEALIEAYAEKASRGLDLYSSEDKHAAYRALGVTCLAYQDRPPELTIDAICSNLETPS